MNKVEINGKTIEFKDKETYWKPIHEFMDIMYKQGGHVSPIMYHEYLANLCIDACKELDYVTFHEDMLAELSEYEVKEFTECLIKEMNYKTKK